MAYKRKGQLTTTGEWARHLRKYLKRQFWKSERKMLKKNINKTIGFSEETQKKKILPEK